IGDAPGDLSAAQGVHAHFFPINPGREEASWKLFAQEAFRKFLAGSYGTDYEGTLIKEFNQLLPETPPWMRTAP
ncbi:MAG: HAD family hydrolase, partial [Lentisphaerae bacterium]|nr:HAD family hydrolase [Lentisphaerota bacterium]